MSAVVLNAPIGLIHVHIQSRRATFGMEKWRNFGCLSLQRIPHIAGRYDWFRARAAWAHSDTVPTSYTQMPPPTPGPPWQLCFSLSLKHRRYRHFGPCGLETTRLFSGGAEDVLHKSCESFFILLGAGRVDLSGWVCVYLPATRAVVQFTGRAARRRR